MISSRIVLWEGHVARTGEESDSLFLDHLEGTGIGGRMILTCIDMDFHGLGS